MTYRKYVSNVNTMRDIGREITASTIISTDLFKRERMRAEIMKNVRPSMTRKSLFKKSRKSDYTEDEVMREARERKRRHVYIPTGEETF